MAHETESYPVTWGGRFTLLAIAVQILLTTASYTANLTNVLVRDGIGSNVDNIADAISRVLRLCVLRNTITFLETAYCKEMINYAINRDLTLFPFARRSCPEEKRVCDLKNSENSDKTLSSTMSGEDNRDLQFQMASMNHTVSSLKKQNFGAEATRASRTRTTRFTDGQFLDNCLRKITHTVCTIKTRFLNRKFSLYLLIKNFRLESLHFRRRQ